MSQLGVWSYDSEMTADFGVNQGLVEEQFLKWVDNPLAVDQAWREYFESLAPDDLPQISSAGTILAPVTAAGLLSPAPVPSGDNGVPASQAAQVAPAGAAAPTEEEEPKDEGVRDSVFLPPTMETPLEVAMPDHPAIVSRASFPPSSEMLAATELQARLERAPVGGGGGAGAQRHQPAFLKALRAASSVRSTSSSLSGPFANISRRLSGNANRIWPSEPTS